MPFAADPARRATSIPGCALRVRREHARTPTSCTRTSCTPTSTARCGSRRTARLDEAQRRPVPERAVPLRRACAHAAGVEGDRDHRGAARGSSVERVGLPADKFEVIHYGLDELPAAVGAESPRTMSGRTRACSLAVSRLEPQKGLDVAVRALAGDPGPPSAGRARRARRGRAATELERLAPSCSVPVLPPRPRRRRRRVAAAGPTCSSIPRAGRASASRCSRRCSPRSPSSRRDVSSIPEIVVDGETGLLVPPDDAASPGGCRHPCSRRAGQLRRARPASRSSRSSRRTMTERTLALYERVSESALVEQSPSGRCSAPAGSARARGGGRPRPSPPHAVGRPRDARSLPRAALPRRERRAGP